jgi:hypothetical protein
VRVSDQSEPVEALNIADGDEVPPSEEDIDQMPVPWQHDEDTSA